MSDQMKVLHIDRHRNGVGGEPFDLVQLGGTIDGEEGVWMAVVFGTEWHTALLSLTEMASEGFGAAFLPETHWRGDCFDGPLRKAIADWDDDSSCPAAGVGEIRTSGARQGWKYIPRKKVAS
jgi:hypothetical protein